MLWCSKEAESFLWVAASPEERATDWKIVWSVFKYPNFTILSLKFFKLVICHLVFSIPLLKLLVRINIYKRTMAFLWCTKWIFNDVNLQHPLSRIGKATSSARMSPPRSRIIVPTRTSSFQCHSNRLIMPEWPGWLTQNLAQYGVPWESRRHCWDLTNLTSCFKKRQNFWAVCWNTRKAIRDDEINILRSALVPRSYQHRLSWRSRRREAAKAPDKFRRRRNKVSRRKKREKNQPPWQTQFLHRSGALFLSSHRGIYV